MRAKLNELNVDFGLCWPHASSGTIRGLKGGGSFGPLRDGEPHLMWWRFYTDRRGDRHNEEPDLVVINVDVIDGHIATADDERRLAS